jgi:benzodiazapine receptor
MGESVLARRAAVRGLSTLSNSAMTSPSAIVRSIPSQSVGLVGWLLGTSAAGALGALASVRAATFYAELTQPAWAPPAWLFGPVWTVLYLLMATSAWLVWRTYGFGRARKALLLFVAQLVANALWTWLFFAWREGALALAELVVLWVLIAMTIAAFWRLNRVAAVLLVPYLAWVSFAGALNLSLWQLNPSIL